MQLAPLTPPAVRSVLITIVTFYVACAHLGHIWQRSQTTFRFILSVETILRIYLLAKISLTTTLLTISEFVAIVKIPRLETT